MLYEISEVILSTVIDEITGLTEKIFLAKNLIISMLYFELIFVLRALDNFGF